MKILNLLLMGLRLTAPAASFDPSSALPRDGSCQELEPSNIGPSYMGKLVHEAGILVVCSHLTANRTYKLYSGEDVKIFISEPTPVVNKRKIKDKVGGLLQHGVSYDGCLFSKKGERYQAYRKSCLKQALTDNKELDQPDEIASVDGDIPADAVYRVHRSPLDPYDLYMLMDPLIEFLIYKITNGPIYRRPPSIEAEFQKRRLESLKKDLDYQINHTGYKKIRKAVSQSCAILYSNTFTQPDTWSASVTDERLNFGS